MGELSAVLSGSPTTAEAKDQSQPARFVAFAFASAAVRDGRFMRSASESEHLRGLLGTQDRQRLADYFAYRSELAAHRVTPEGLLRRWSTLVVAFEEGGYAGDIAELTNDLDGRDILEEALSLISPSGKVALSREILPFDERYEAATIEVAEPAKPDQVWIPRSWWWYRLPKRSTQDFQTSLGATGTPT
jgi:hypothetical protein